MEGLAIPASPNFTNTMISIEALSDREKRVIQERMGLTGNKPKSRSEVCQMFAISEDRLRRLEEKAKDLLSK